DSFVDEVVINGVDVTEYVNDRDPWYPLRAMLHPTDRNGMLAAWDALEAEWAPTIDRATALTDAQRRTSVGGEWSFVDTLRHLVFCMDKWFTVPVLGEPAFDPMGRSNSGSVDFPWPGVDRDADPTFEEVLAVRASQAATFRDFLESVTPTALDREVEVLENGPGFPVRDCIFVVFEEEFEHHRYAVRDLVQITG
ncbi:MAG TPA: DinB family protein, partial [Acidimicrobiales bacterium]|nr:DinB family protein [Acidimicrobiales bacterium]